jgi:hypothetical protein
MRYFRILDSFDVVDRWYLGAPETKTGKVLDPRLFTEGILYDGFTVYPAKLNTKTPIANSFADELPLRIQVQKGTAPMDFTLGSFEMPVVRPRIAEHLDACCGRAIQLIPASINGDQFEILNVLEVLDAIDEQHSEISRWTVDDGVPEKIGSYFGVARLALATAKVMNARIFRLKNWTGLIIVNDEIKGLLQSHNPTGIQFSELDTF